MPIKTKLLLLVSFLIATAIANALLGLYGMRQGVNGMRALYEERVVPLRDLKEIVDAYAVNIVDTNHKVRNGNFTIDQGLASLKEAEGLIRELWQQYKNRPLTAEELAMVAQIEPLMVRGDEATQTLASLFRQGDQAGIAAFSATELYPAIDPVSEVFSQLIQVQLAVAAKDYQENQARYDRMTLIVGLTLLLVAFTGITLAWFVIDRNVTRPLQRASAVATAVKEGDLTGEILTRRQDEVGVILRQLAAMQNGLRQLVGTIRDSIGEVRSTVTALADNANATADVTQHQTHAAASVAASVEQLSTAIQHVDERSREAHRITLTTEEQLQQSAAVIAEAAEGIQGVADAVNGAAETLQELEQLSGQI